MFALHLGNYLDDVGADGLKGAHYGTVRNGEGGALEDEVVGHVIDCEPHVAFGNSRPFCLQGDAVPAFDGVSGDVADIEASSADCAISISSRHSNCSRGSTH